MKKFISIFLALAMCTALCTACSNNNSDSGSNSGSGSNSDSGQGGGNASDGKVYEMTFGTHENDSGLASTYIKYWVNLVEEKTDGRIKVNVYWSGSLVGMSEAYDAVINGSIDATWCTPMGYAGRFPMSEVFSLPMNGVTSGVMGSAVAWDMFENNQAIADEWKDFKVISFHTNGAVPIATTKHISSIADVNGLRLRSVFNPVINWMSEFGCIPASFAMMDTYENLSKNVADGAVQDYQALDTTRCYEVLDTVLDCAVNYPTSGIVMSWDFYNSLPEDLQKIIDEECSGFDVSLEGGWRWFNSDVELREKFADEGVNIIFPDQATYDTMQAAADKAINTWIADWSAQGYPAQEVWDEFQDTVAKYASEYGDLQPDWYDNIQR